MTDKTDNAGLEKLEIQRIYAKNISLEVVNTPQVFRKIIADKDWNPDVKVDLKVEHVALDHANITNIFEIVLLVRVSVQPKDSDEIFHITVIQAGIFHIAGFDEDETKYLLAVHCPEILFPYARETVSSLVSRASFPQLNLMPVNFNALYEQHVK